jgi:hypothetical protein
LAGGGVLLFLILLSKETGVRNRILAAISSALCVAGMLFVPAQAASGAPHPGLVFQLQEGHWGSLCDNASPRLCARDPSDGGLGTQIKMSNYSGDNAMQWKPVRATMCGGTVGNNCPDLALSQRYPNDPIYYFVNRGSGDCLGANSASVWVVVMKTCDDTDTLFVYNLVDNGCLRRRDRLAVRRYRARWPGSGRPQLFLSWSGAVGVAPRSPAGRGAPSGGHAPRAVRDK